MILLEIGGDALLGIFLLIILIMIGPPILFLILGIVFRKRKPNRSKIFFIIGAVYLLIAGGLCGSMWM